MLKCILFIIFYISFVLWGTEYLPFEIHTPFLFLLTISVLSFLTRTNIYNSIFVIFITGLLIGIIDILISGIFVLIMQKDINSLLLNETSYTMIAIVSKLLLIICALLFYSLNKNKLKITVFKNNNSQYLYIFVQLFFLMLFIISINYNIDKNIDFFRFNVFLTILFILNFILALFDIREREHILNVLNKKKSLEEYVRTLEDVIHVIRREKHDYSNHIQTVYAMTQLHRADILSNIQNYLSRLMSDLKSVYKFYETGNIYIDGLLAIKSNICFDNSIQLNVTINSDFSLVAADESDTAGIVGNVINNAIECLLSNKNTQNKEIHFDTYILDDKFHIRISNNGPQIQASTIDKLFNNGYTTKVNSTDHGYGLFITKQLLNKNRGSVNVSSTKDLTTFDFSFGLEKGVLHETHSGFIAG